MVSNRCWSVQYQRILGVDVTAETRVSLPGSLEQVHDASGHAIDQLLGRRGH